MLKFILLLVAAAFCISSMAQVATWQAPEGFSSQKYYTVKVDGVPVPVYDTPIASYAIFDFNTNAKVEVTTTFDVRWVDIRPLKSAIKPTNISDNSFAFTMVNPQNLSVELNGRIRQQPLFIFSNLPEKDKPSMKDKNVIWFEGGKIHKDVKLELQDNQTVYIEGGAVVQGYIFAAGKKNIKICGRGILDGSFNRTGIGSKNKFLHFKDCEKVTINDIVLHNGTTWQIAAFFCKQFSITNARIVSESGGDDGMDIFRCSDVVVSGVFAHTKDDCIAIKSGGKGEVKIKNTENILVKDCIFWNSIWGNAIEIGFELYSEEVKNVRFENIDIIHVEDGAAMSIHNAGQAHVYNVVFENIRVEDVRQKLFDVAIFFSQWGPDGTRDDKFNEQYYLHGAWDGVQRIPEGKEDYHRAYRGTVSNILFKDIQVVDGTLPFSVFYGFDKEKNISGVTIENLTYRGLPLKTLEAAKISMKNTEGLIIK